MDLLTLAAAKNYANKITNTSGYQLIERVQLTHSVQNVGKIEIVPAEKTESGKDEIRLYEIIEKQPSDGTSKE